MLTRLRCALDRHDDVLQSENGRLFLRCLSCGRETPGWNVMAPIPSSVPPPVPLVMVKISLE